MGNRKTIADFSDVVVCVGNSMYPTLHALDTLSVLPYGSRKMHPGDVIVLTGPGGRRVAHRIVSVTSGGIMTRGDNNRSVDEWILCGEDVLGQVVCTIRKARKIKVHGGKLGYLIGVKCHVICRFRLALLGMVKPLYDLVSRSGLLRPLVPVSLRPRVSYYGKRHGTIELQLQMGQKSIGWYDPHRNRWMIKPPYRLFVDESALPCEAQFPMEKQGE